MVSPLWIFLSVVLVNTCIMSIVSRLGSQQRYLEGSEYEECIILSSVFYILFCIILVHY